MIDTAAKRGSALQIGRPWRMTTPLPDGTVDAFDRAHLAFSYHIEQEAIGVPRCGWAVSASSRIFSVPGQPSVFQVGPGSVVFGFRRCP